MTLGTGPGCQKLRTQAATKEGDLKPYYEDSLVTLYCGNAREILPHIEADSIACCVTSPPYWGLRDYGTAAWIGGNTECDDHVNPRATGQRADRCGKCGARRVDRQIGLETTPEAYTAQMVEVFRSVRRVLRADGTAWVNLGDSYATQPYADSHTFDPKYRGRNRSNGYPNRQKQPGIKHKDLVGIPWRIAFALQADGWYLRSDIIWSKPNPMPESVTDRPTKAHEYLFLLAKSERYFYDAAAIREPASPDTHARYARGRSDSHKWADGGPGNQTIATNKAGSRFARVPAGWHQGTRPVEGLAPRDQRDKRAPGVNPKCADPGGIKQNTSFSAAVKDVLDYRNKRSVWTINTQPFPEAHFATFPEALVEPCIKAGSPAGGVILDPFSGSGTVGVVAKRLGCRAVLIELNQDYCDIAIRRLAQQTLDLQEAATA